MSLENGVKKFGVVLFDDDKDPAAGWAYVEGERLVTRIAAPEDLSSDTIWWSNVSYDRFFFRTDLHKCPWLRHDAYLVVTRQDILREWNYDPRSIDPETACRVTAKFFARIMQISFDLMKAVVPRITMAEAFAQTTLRGDMRIVLPNLEYPRPEAVAIMKADRAFSEFTATAARPVKDMAWMMVMVRKPRLSYAIEMLQTPIPVGPFEFMTRKDLKDVDLRLEERPFMAEVAVGKVDPELASVYGFGASNQLPHGWVAQNEFSALARIADLEVKSAWVGKGYTSLMEALPAAVRDFLGSSTNSSSWSAGVVAETLWRACCLRQHIDGAAETEEYNAMSWAGAWIKAADKISMFASAIELARLGYSVPSYGLGWLRAAVTKETLEDFVRDGLAHGMVPSMTEIPDDQSSIEDAFVWGGDRNAKGLVRLQTMKQRDLLLNLDRLPLLAA